MIALITSTLAPSNIYSSFSNDERYQQTLLTIRKLHEKGFKEIILIDNSIATVDLNTLQRDSNVPLKVYHTPMFSFSNKGVNEALLILNNLDKLTESTPIFKISGRYYPNENFNKADFDPIKQFDFVGVGENFDKKISYFSTRAYVVKDKKVLEQILVLAIEEILSYHRGVYGFRSFVKMVESFFVRKLGASYQLSLEQAFALILKDQKNYKLLNKINIEGSVAGYNQQSNISE